MHHVDLNQITLAKGAHKGKNGPYCVMEWVSLFADEAKPGKQTAHPKCSSPVLTSFAIVFNDLLDDETRQRLVPFIPRLVGTAGSKKLDEMRGWMATDWLARVYAPAFLRLTPSLAEHADTLAALAPLTSGATAKKAKPLLAAAYSAARSAADSAARSAAYAAAYAAADSAADSAYSAAYAAAYAAADSAADSAAYAAADSAADSAYSAAYAAAYAAADSAYAAAYAAADSAAYSAADSAAYSAARSAAQAIFVPVTSDLQESAFALLDRMIDAGGAK